MVEEIKNNDLGRAASSPFAVIDFNDNADAEFLENLVGHLHQFCLIE